MFGFLKKISRKSDLHPMNQLGVIPAENVYERASQRAADCTLIHNTECLRLVLRHIKTLVTKYEQAIYRDDYDNIELDEASKQVDYFINKTLRNGLLSAALPSHISRNDYMQTLSLDDPDFFDDQRELISEFINIMDREAFEDAISSTAISHMAFIKSGASDETMRFLFGDDFLSIRNLACDMNDMINNLMSDTEQYHAAQDSIMNSLISSQDLENVKKWFCERHGQTTALADIITGQEFELFCQRQLEELGWIVRATRATGDFGADLVVERAGATIIIIQCKYYSKPIGVKAVQEAFSAMTFYNANKSAVVSNQSFTKAARQMAEKNNVALLHVNHLSKLG